MEIEAKHVKWLIHWQTTWNSTVCPSCGYTDCNLTLNPALSTLAQTLMETGALKSGPGQTLSPQSLQSTKWDTYVWIWIWLKGWGGIFDKDNSSETITITQAGSDDSLSKERAEEMERRVQKMSGGWRWKRKKYLWWCLDYGLHVHYATDQDKSDRKKRVCGKGGGLIPFGHAKFPVTISCPDQDAK